MKRHRRSLLQLVPFLIAVAAVSATGSLFRPGAWYAALALPSWTPPPWVFAPVWSVLYCAIAIAGWLIWTTPGAKIERLLWGAQLALNGLWSWLFFGLHRVGLALVDLSAWILVLAILLLRAWISCRPAFWLLGPYLAWVLYAMSLNIGIFLLNAS